MSFTHKSTLCTLVLVLSAISIAHAVAPAGKQVTPTLKLQGGSESSADWAAPATSSYKIHVFVPKNTTATNALYRIYPKGKRADSTECLSTDAEFPCYEASIDQSQHQNAWTQLMVGDAPKTQWAFTKGKGYVTAVASNLAATELLNLSALVRFENQTIKIGKTYQGGLIFYIDGTGEHGLVAAPKDHSAGIIKWYNGTFINTGATATAVGTGAANTSKIIKAQGAGRYAAQLTANLVLNGYDDWFLPSKDELYLMYQNIGQGAHASLYNIGGFARSYYWSSSEYGNDNAWSYDFGSGLLYYIPRKSNRFLVRAVRAF